MSTRSPPKVFIETRMEERTSLSTCSTTRSRAAIKKSPIEPTMQDGRETSRSQVIDVSSFCVEPRANVRLVNSKTSPCVPAPRPHLVTHVRVVDVVNLHKEVVSACQAAPHTTPHTHNTTQNKTQHTHHTHHTTPHGDRETQRQRQRETERNRERDRERETRQDKTRQEKRTRDNGREETRRWKRREETGEDEREG